MATERTTAELIAWLHLLGDHLFDAGLHEAADRLEALNAEVQTLRGKQ